MEKKKKQKEAIIIGGIVLFLLLIAVIVVLVVLLLKKNGEVIIGDDDTPQGYVINEENYQQIQDEMDAKVQEGYFETYMNMEWKFPDGDSESTDAVLGNSPNNTKPIRCEVTLKDSGETVLTTGVIPVGVQLPPFKLDADLDAGTYSAVCTIYLLDELEDGTYRDYSDAGFNITIIVEN